MKEKSIIGLFLGVLAYLVGQITMVTIVFFVFILIDLITGVLGSVRNQEKYNKQKAIDGVIKKAGYLIFWVLGVLLQLILIEQGGALGITIPIPIITLVVTFWLLGTEGLSIINNLSRMGVKGIPKMFTDYFDKMKNYKKE